LYAAKGDQQSQVSSSWVPSSRGFASLIMPLFERAVFFNRNI
jgi:hypothetical protein